MNWDVPEELTAISVLVLNWGVPEELTVISVLVLNWGVPEELTAINSVLVLDFWKLRCQIVTQKVLVTG